MILMYLKYFTRMYTNVSPFFPLTFLTAFTSLFLESYFSLQFTCCEINKYEKGVTEKTHNVFQ